MRLILQPTEPDEWITEVFFGLGGTCWPCDELYPGHATYGTDLDLYWDYSALPEFPQLIGWGPQYVLAYTCQGDPGFHRFWQAQSEVGFAIDQPVFIGTFTAWVHEPYHPACPLPPADLMAFTDGQPGNTILLASPSLAVDERQSPAKLTLLSSYPNPFNPRTTVTFTLPAAGQAQVAIYDAKGQMVARLVDESLPAGAHTVDWDGRDTYGASMPSGMYFCRLTTAEGTQTRKLSLIR